MEFLKLSSEKNLSDVDIQKATSCQNSIIFPWFFINFQIPWYFHAWIFSAIFHVFQSLWEPWMGDPLDWSPITNLMWSQLPIGPGLWSCVRRLESSRVAQLQKIVWVLDKISESTIQYRQPIIKALIRLYRLLCPGVNFSIILQISWLVVLVFYCPSTHFRYFWAQTVNMAIVPGQAS